jgi:hypothetical protein
MMNLKTIAAGVAIAGSMGFAALGIGTGVANAAPSPVGSGSQWALDPSWDHGGHDWNGGGRGPDWHNGGGPRWAPPPPPPPPPPPNYGYGGYNGYGDYNGYNGYGGGCVTGPLGLLHFCP